MVMDNKFFGCFRFLGILFVLWGVFQVQVVFDIDVNGLLQVSVIDCIIGCKQLVLIQGGLNFNEEDVIVLLVEVEVRVDEDRCKCNQIECCNWVQILFVQVEWCLWDVLFELGFYGVEWQ